MNLIVDIGNTRTKYAVFDEGDWVECGLGLPEVYDLATTYLILSSTGAISAEVRERLREVSTFFCEVSSEIPLPIRLGYDTPKTLGVDRIAGCVGGAFLFPGRELLVIDSGTAITYDFVSAGVSGRKYFSGAGYSFPGVKRVYRESSVGEVFRGTRVCREEHA